jgi:hypothetical protein
VPRTLAPGSKLSTLTWWGDTSLGPGLGVDAASLALRSGIFTASVAFAVITPARHCLIF